MKALKVLGGVVVLQLVLVGLYLAVEATRSEPSHFAMETLDEPVPPLTIERAGLGVAPPGGPHLVHFWATWCAPCAEELPGLLEAADDAEVPLLAVTDEDWAVLEPWFGGEVPDAIVRDPSSGAAAAWGVSGLPDTFVVREGRIVARMGGPRDWRSPGAEELLDELRRTR